MDRRRELQERAIAARVAQSDSDGWKKFMDMLDNRDPYEGEDERLERISRDKPQSNYGEGDIECQKLT